MKKRIMLAIIIIVLIFITFIVLKNVVICPTMYKNNALLSVKENESIKTLVLKALKDRNSCLYTINQTSIYSFENKENIIQLESPNEKKSFLCAIDGNFMQSLVKSDEHTYELIVNAYYPEHCYYHFTIESFANGYIITHFLIDI